MKLFFIFSSPSAFLSRIPAAQDMQKFIWLFCQPALPRIPHQIRRVKLVSSSRDYSHDENKYSPAPKSDNYPSRGLRDEARFHFARLSHDLSHKYFAMRNKNGTIASVLTQYCRHLHISSAILHLHLSAIAPSFNS